MTTKRKISTVIFAAMVMLFFSASSKALDSKEAENNSPALYRESPDGELRPGEYEVISTNGALTRSLCPYRCEMRGIPKEHCRAWQSISDKNLCYLWDTRYPQTAVPMR